MTASARSLACLHVNAAAGNGGGKELLRRVPSKGARQNQKAPHVCTAARAPSSCPVLLLLLPSRPRTGGRLRTAESGPAVANAAAARLLHCTHTVLLVRRPPAQQAIRRSAGPPSLVVAGKGKERTAHARGRARTRTCQLLHLHCAALRCARLV